MTAIPTEQLAVQELFDLSLDFDQFQIFPTALGVRLVSVVGKGRVEGPRLQGEVLPGGGDWLLLGNDGIARMDVRGSIRAPGGELIYITGWGRTQLFDGADDRFVAGETVTAEKGEVRARLGLFFEAPDGEYAWLNATVGVGVVNELSQRHIHYRVYAVD